MNNLLINERPLTIQPSLITVFGLQHALILQQVHFASQQPKSGKIINGEKWIWNSYEEWRDNWFPFWSTENIRKHFTALENAGLLLSCQPEAFDRTKFYRINYDKIGEEVPVATYNGVPVRSVTRVPDGTVSQVPVEEEAETSSETTAEKTHAAFAASVVFEEWKSTLKHPNSKLDKKRLQRINARLKEGFTVEQLKLVPHGVLKSPYHLGDNPTKTKYDGIETVFRDAAQVEKFIALALPWNGAAKVTKGCDECLNSEYAKPERMNLQPGQIYDKERNVVTNCKCAL